MNRRMMAQEKSLNDPIKSDEKSEWQDWIVDDSLDQELFISQKQELDEKKSLLHESIKILDDREKEIIEERKLSENPKTFEELSKKYKISIQKRDGCPNLNHSLNHYVKNPSEITKISSYTDTY